MARETSSGGLENFLDFKQEHSTETRPETAMALIEQEESTLIDNQSARQPKNPRLMRAFLALSLGVSGIFANQEALAANKGETGQKAKIETQMQEAQKKLDELNRHEAEQKKAERNKELNDWLADFKVEGLTIDEPKIQVKTNCEQLGIYLKEKHLGDIYSDKCTNRLSFSEAEFTDAVSKILKEAGIKFEATVQKINFAVDIKPEAAEILKQWGGAVNGNKIDIGMKDNILEVDKNTKSVTLLGSGKDTLTIIVEDTDGTKHVVTCVNKQVESIK